MSKQPQHAGRNCRFICPFYEDKDGEVTCLMYAERLAYKDYKPLRCEFCIEDFGEPNPPLKSRKLRRVKPAHKYVRRPEKKRKLKEDRRAHIIRAGIEASKKSQWGYKDLTRTHVAKRAGVSEALVSHYFKMDELKVEIMRYAILSKSYKLLAQGLYCNDPTAKGAPNELKQRAIEKYELKI